MSNQKKNVFDDVSTDDDFSSQDEDSKNPAAAADHNAAPQQPEAHAQSDDESSDDDGNDGDEEAPHVDATPSQQKASTPSNAANVPPPTVRHMDPQRTRDEEEESEDEDDDEAGESVPPPKKKPAEGKKEELVFKKTLPDPAEKVQQDINHKDMRVTTSVTNTPSKVQAEEPARNKRQNVEPEDDSYYYYSSEQSGADKDSEAGDADGEGGDDEEDEGDNEQRMLLDYVLNEDDNASDWTRYLFPRFDRRLLNYQYNLDNKIAAGKSARKDPTRKEDETDEAPNPIELFVAYIIAGDMRLSACAAFVLLAIVFTIAAIPLSQIDIPGRQCYTLFGYKENCDRSTYASNLNFLTCNGIKHRLQAGAAFIIISLAVELFTFVALILVVFCGPMRRKKMHGGHATHQHIPLTQADSEKRAQEDERFNNYYLYHQEQQVESVASCRSRWIIGGISLSNIVFLLIPWAIVAGIVTSNTCVADVTTKAQYDRVIAAQNVTTQIAYNTDKYYSYGVGFGLLISAWALNAFGLFVLLVTPVALI